MHFIPEGARKYKFPCSLLSMFFLLLVEYMIELCHLHLELAWAQLLFDINLILSVYKVAQIEEIELLNFAIYLCQM